MRTWEAQEKEFNGILWKRGMFSLEQIWMMSKVLLLPLKWVEQLNQKKLADLQIDMHLHLLENKQLF